MLSSTSAVLYECGQWATDCVRNRPPQQLTAILRKYLNDNPRDWNAPAGWLAWRALFLPCGPLPE